METAIQFTTVFVTTLAALFAALALQSALLKATLRLMQPAAANRPAGHIAIEQGTRLVARAYTTGN
jgi:hypothetical protein